MSRFPLSPLLGTAGVAAGLALLAIPLQRLTSRPATPAVVAAAPSVPAGSVAAVLRVKTVDPLERLAVADAQGRILLQATPFAAGESEHDVVIPWDDGVGLLSIEFESAKETAVFVTLLPEGREDLTRYATGSGACVETLRFEWPGAH